MGLPLPHVTSFCWCMGLEMGAKFVGLIHLVLALIAFGFCTKFATYSWSLHGTAADLGDGLYTRWFYVSLAVAILSVFHASMATTLLVSVWKRYAKGVRAWVWLMFVLFVACLLYLLVLLIVTGTTASGSEMFLSLLQAVLYYSFMLYCIICVNSYYLMLRSSQDESKAPASLLRGDVELRAHRGNMYGAPGH